MKKNRMNFFAGCLSLMVLFSTACNKKEEIAPNEKSNVENSEWRIQAVNYAYVIKPSESTLDNNVLKIPAGSYVAIEAGTRGPLYLKNFVGQPGKPITFINHSSGQTIFKGSGSWALKVGYCKNIRITGTGSSDTYGILVDGGHNSITLPELTTDFEIDHVEVKNSGFAGIMGKTDPNCNSSTWRQNFVMTNVSLHDNYIHDVKGEGFYIGNSFYNGKSESCGTVYPHEIHGLRIYKNIVKNSGCEGIQVGCAAKDCEIYDNSIENFGTDPFAAYQNNGMQIGAGTSGKCYNNFIRKGPGNGLQMMGIGGNLIYNNVIADAGSIGIFADERTAPIEGFTFINNTIVNPGSDGMRLYCEQVPMNNLINNIIVNPKSGKYINPSSGVKLNEKNNYYTMDISSVKFVNPSSGNYSLQSSSPVINKGLDVASYGVTYDLTRQARPHGGTFDVGAYEYTGTIVNPNPNPDPIPTDPTPVPNPVAQVTNLTLINSSTDRDLGLLTNGQEINFTTLGTSKLNVRANTSTGTGSVVFTLDGRAYRTESYAPFALAGDGSGGNYNDWTPSAGKHTLVVTPYTLAGGKGTAGIPVTIEFNVVSGTVTNPPTTPPATGSTVKFAPTDDAFLHDGTRYNNKILRAEYSRRTSYLKYNVQNVSSVSSAKLRIKCEGDGGKGTIRVASGSHNNWTESTITSSSAPVVSGIGSSLNNTFEIGKVYEVDLTSIIKSAGTYTIIVTMDAGGNDASFSSKTGSFAPELIITQ